MHLAGLVKEQLRRIARGRRNDEQIGGQGDERLILVRFGGLVEDNVNILKVLGGSLASYLRELGLFLQQPLGILGLVVLK